MTETDKLLQKYQENVMNNIWNDEMKKMATFIMNFKPYNCNRCGEPKLFHEFYHNKGKTCKSCLKSFRLKRYKPEIVMSSSESENEDKKNKITYEKLKTLYNKTLWDIMKENNNYTDIKSLFLKYKLPINTLSIHIDDILNDI